MASLDSDKVQAALKTKLKCSEEKGDHYWYTLYDDDGKTVLGRTMISHGKKHSLGSSLIHSMTRQLRLGTSANFVAMVQCTKSREDCLTVIKDLSSKSK